MRAIRVCGGRQAGRSDADGTDRADLWEGTASLWVDLHVSLPPLFT
jgi:hypothetical protein